MFDIWWFLWDFENCSRTCGMPMQINYQLVFCYLARRSTIVVTIETTTGAITITFDIIFLGPNPSGYFMTRIATWLDFVSLCESYQHILVPPSTAYINMLTMSTMPTMMMIVRPRLLFISVFISGRLWWLSASLVRLAFRIYHNNRGRANGPLFCIPQSIIIATSI